MNEVQGAIDRCKMGVIAKVGLNNGMKEVEREWSRELWVEKSELRA